MSKLSPGAVASKYYHEEGYYTGNTKEAQDNSFWHGKAAETAGISGPVEDGKFQELLAGLAPNGQDIAAANTGHNERRMGYDLTFSAPKDISVMALVGGDHRLLEAQDKAVKAALDVVEREGVKVSVYDPATKGKIRVDGQSAIFGVFRHDTSRELDPQVHSHAIVVNMAEDQDGKFRAIANEDFYNKAKYFDAVYKSTLASEVQNLGYSVRREGVHGDIRIDGLPQDIAPSFSKRSAVIKDMMKDSNDANVSAAAERAALATRASKAKDVDRGELHNAWLNEVKELGHSPALFEKLITNTKSITHNTDRSHTEVSPTKAVTQAIQHHSERASVYSKTAVIEFALNHSVGVTPNAVQTELASRIKDGRLFDAGTNSLKDGMTDKATVARERILIAEMEKGQGQSHAALRTLTRWAKNPQQAVARSLKDTTLTLGQKDAAQLMLTSKDRVVGIQGHAGTGKTFMLERAQAVANRNGFKMESIGPSAKSVEALQGSNIDAQTVARFLIAARQQGTGKKSDTILVVDEASMVDTRNMVEVLRVANKAGYNRVVLMGDISQLASVGAGAAFKQLQNNGMPMAHMSEINRQKNDILKDAIYDTINKDITAAFKKIGDRIIPVKDADYVRATADAYLALSPDQRQGTGVIAQSNKARVDLNAKIRDGLISEGLVSQDGVNRDHFNNQNLTIAQKQDSRSYVSGHQIIVMADIANTNMKQGDRFSVLRADAKTGRLIVRDTEQKERTLNVGESEVASKLGVFALEARTYAKGDAIIFRTNDKEVGVINGARGTITAVSGSQIQVAKLDGKNVTLTDDSLAQKTMDHAYSATVHSYQGETVERILVAMGSREALTNTASFYVGISRAKTEAIVYTDDVSKLAQTVVEKTGVSTPALEAIQEANAQLKEERELAIQRNLNPEKSPNEIRNHNDPNKPEEGQTMDGRNIPTSTTKKDLPLKDQRDAAIDNKDALATDQAERELRHDPNTDQKEREMEKGETKPEVEIER